MEFNSLSPWRLLAILSLLSASLLVVIGEAPAQATPPLPARLTGSALTTAGSLGPFRQSTPIVLRGEIHALRSPRTVQPTGTLSLSVDDAPAETIPLTLTREVPYIALGDDLTATRYLANSAQGYPARLAGIFGLSLTTLALPGKRACDLFADEIAPHHLGEDDGETTLYTLLVGAEDLRQGLGEPERSFNLCNQAALSWLGTTRDDKVLPGDPDAGITNGLWTAKEGRFTATGLANLRFTLTTKGAPAYLWYALEPGTFSISIDRGPPLLLTPEAVPEDAEDAPPGPAVLPHPRGVALLRLPVPAGTHTFDLASLSGTVTFLGMGSPGVATPPTILVAAPPLPGSDPAAAAAYSADLEANRLMLQNDNLDLRFVATAPHLRSLPDETLDPTHLSARGQAHLARAFAAALAPFDATPYTSLTASATITRSDLSPGPHTLLLHYSGDASFAPATTRLSFEVLTSTSSVALSAPRARARSPVTLTATVPQASSTGVVLFSERTSTGEAGLGSAILSGHAATLTLPSLPTGTHTVLALYQGDAEHDPATSQPVPLDVVALPSATTLSAPGNNFGSGAPVALTAGILPADATGTVTFSDGAQPIGTATVANGAATLTTTSLPIGTRTLTAAYSGDTTYANSASQPLLVTIHYAGATVTLTPFNASQPYGTSIPITATVFPATASGSITFNDALTGSIAQAPLQNGATTINTSTLVVGTHTLTALYPGDANNHAATSEPVQLVVTLNPTTTTLNPLPAHIPYGPTTLAANTSALTGTLTFRDSLAGVLAQVALQNGSANLLTTALTAGPHTLSAAYPGDNTHAPSNSPGISIQVDPALTSITLAPPPATLAVTSPLALTASVIPSAATGTILFRDATVGTLGQVAVTHGGAALTLNHLSPGTYTLSASYSGDPNDTASNSNTQTVQITLVPTTLTLTPLAPSTTYSTPLVLTASVLPATATGLVTFRDSLAPYGRAQILNGVATLTLPSLPAGPHTLFASYEGDLNDAPARSGPVTTTILPVTSTVILSLAENPTPAGSPVLINVQVTTLTGTAPTGTVSIGSPPQPSAAGTLGHPLGGSAFATLSLPTPAVGSFQAVATYAGDPDSAPATSIPISYTVVPTPVSGLLTLTSSQILASQSVQVTATLSASSPPTGSITFLNNGAPFATVPLNAGVASTSLSGLDLGEYSLSAVYIPTGLFGAVTLAPQTVLVTRAITLALAPQTLTIGPGSAAPSKLTITPFPGFTGVFTVRCSSPVSYITCSAPANTISLKAATTVPITVSVAANLEQVAQSRPPLLPLALLLPLLALRRASRRRFTLLLFAATLSGCAEGGTFFEIPPGSHTIPVSVYIGQTTTTVPLTVTTQ